MSRKYSTPAQKKKRDAALANLYRLGLSQTILSKISGLNQAYVSQILRTSGVQIRSQKIDPEIKKQRRRSTAAKKRARRTENEIAAQRAYQVAWARKNRMTNPEKAKQQNRDSFRRRAYGVEPEFFKMLFEKQNKKCGCCESSTPKGSHDWCLDHDHTNGKVRGVLCRECNTLLGYVGDTPDKLDATIQKILHYLKYVE